MKITKKHIAGVVKKGNWIIRADNDGVSYNNFKWLPIGEWTEAPDWNEKPKCGGGLHGQDKDYGGFIAGKRLVFCETKGKHIAIEDNKVKVKKARILLVNKLPAGLTAGERINLSGCTGLTTLPAGLTAGEWIDLSGCTGLTETPDTIRKKLNCEIYF